MKDQLTRRAIWAAHLSGVTALLSFAAYLAFLVFDLPGTMQRGSVNQQTLTGDLIGLFQGLSVLFMIPLALALHQLVGSRSGNVSRIALVIGIASMSVLLAFNLLVVLHIIPETQAGAPISFFLGGIGVWLVAANYLARGSFLPKGLAWLGIVIGAAYILFMLTYWISGAANVESQAALQSNLLFLVGYAALSLSSFILYPIWAIWLGRVLSRMSLVARQQFASVGG